MKCCIFGLLVLLANPVSAEPYRDVDSEIVTWFSTSLDKRIERGGVISIDANQGRVTISGLKGVREYPLKSVVRGFSLSVSGETYTMKVAGRQPVSGYDMDGMFREIGRVLEVYEEI